MISDTENSIGFQPDNEVGFTPEKLEEAPNPIPPLEPSTPEQAKAFENLDKISADPKEARARVVNQSYYTNEFKALPDGNWTTVRNTIGKEMFGQVGETSDSTLHELTRKRDEQMLFSRKPEWAMATPFNRFRMLMGAFPDHFMPTQEKTFKGGFTPFKEIPSFQKDLPNIPAFGASNPALVGGVWNSVVKPVVEGIETPVGVLTLGVGTALKAAATAGVSAAKPIATLMQAAFAAIMAKATIDTAPNTMKVVKDPNATFQDKVEAVGNFVTPAMMSVGGALGALKSVRPELIDKIADQHPAEAVQTLKEEAEKAPVAEAEHMNDLAREIAKIAPDEPVDIGPRDPNVSTGTGVPTPHEEAMMAAWKDQIASEQPKTAAKSPSEIAQSWDEVKKVFAPASRGPKAEVTAGSLREHGASLALRTDRAAAALEDASKVLMKMDPAERWAAVDRIENGTYQPSPELKAFAETARQILDTKREEIRALGTGKLDHFIKDYFPHIWKDPEAAASAFQKAQGKAPLEGSKSFLKQRTIPTTAEGIALGLEPVSSNPVELVLLKAREMDKYLLGQKWLAEMKAKSFVKFVPAGAEAPEGYVEINDKIATVYGPRTGAVKFGPEVNTLTVSPSDVTVMGQRIMGKYYAPSEVAVVANNYLSPGLRKYASFRAYLTAANSLNQFQLGLSAFHLGFTSIDASISKLSLALEYGAQGRPVKAAAKAAQVPFAPFSNAVEGNRVLKEWMKPGSQGDDIGKIVDSIRLGGGRAKMDSFYQTTITKRMQELFREGGAKGYLGAAWRAPLAAIEQTSKPIMEYVVPRQKLGVAADMIRMENERMSPNATLEEKRAIYGKVWDSVDNRMGQMVYDNLFWNKVAKDMAMASVRSVGWNLGTFRELGGGLKDAAKFSRDIVTPGKDSAFTHRMAYSIALPVMTGILGATYQYLRTGKGPEELRDYFFPKTGEKDPQGRAVRLAIPSYMKDVYHYGHDPVGTVEGKVHPAISLMIQMLNNKDYFGRDIRHADDPLVKQMADEAKHFSENFVPIGIRQFEQSSAAGVGTGERAANFLGITRAPAWVGETDAEQLAGKLAGDKFKSTSAPDAKVVAKRQKIMAELRSGDATERAKANAELNEMVQSGELSPVQRRNLIKGTDHTYLENALSHLDAREAMRVFSAASIEERKAVRDVVERKVLHAHLPEADHKALVDQLEKLLPKRDINTTLRK